MSDTHSPGIETFTAEEMRAYAVSQLDQAAAAFLEGEAMIRVWNRRAAKTGQDRLPMPKRPRWLVKLLADVKADGQEGAGDD